MIIIIMNIVAMLVATTIVVSAYKADKGGTVVFFGTLLIMNLFAAIVGGVDYGKEIGMEEAAASYCAAEVQQTSGWAEMSNAALLDAVRSVQPAVDIDVDEMHKQCFDILQELAISTAR